MLIGFTWLFIMKIFSVLLTLSALVTAIRADLSKYYDNEDYSSQEYDYYDDQYQDMAQMAQERRSHPHPPPPEGGSSPSSFTPSEGVDFSGCTKDPQSGMCCLMKEEEIQTLEKDPILECTHKNTEQCHYTYVTQFKPSREEVCEESFDKKCSISFVQQARNETLEKCYRPLVKVCGETEEEEINSIADSRRKRRRRRRFKKNAKFESKKTCQTYFETSCTTRYLEKTPGKFVADTACEKLPIELCGEGRPGLVSCCPDNLSCMQNVIKIFLTNYHVQDAEWRRGRRSVTRRLLPVWLMSRRKFVISTQLKPADLPPSWFPTSVPPTSVPWCPERSVC